MLSVDTYNSNYLYREIARTTMNITNASHTNSRSNLIIKSTKQTKKVSHHDRLRDMVGGERIVVSIAKIKMREHNLQANLVVQHGHDYRFESSYSFVMPKTLTS